MPRNLRRTPQEKLKNLILLVIKKCNEYEDQHLASTKLNKLLFFSDFLAFRELGQAITGLDYQRIQNGPAPVCMLPLTEEMRRIDHSLEMQSQARFFPTRYDYQIPVAKKEPDLTFFEEDEIDLVDRVVRNHLHETGSQISDRAYNEFGLRNFKIRQRIPYGLALIGNGDLSQDDVAFAIENGLVEKAAAWRESRSG